MKDQVTECMKIDAEIVELQQQLLKLYRETDDYERTINMFKEGKFNFDLLLKFSPESTAIYERLIELTNKKYGK